MLVGKTKQQEIALSEHSPNGKLGRYVGTQELAKQAQVSLHSG